MAKVNFNKDALKKHHFWIIAAVVPLLILIAVLIIWSGAGGAIAAGEKAITTSVEGASKKAPKGKWIEGELEKQKTVVASKKDKLWEFNWNDQKDLFTWPMDDKGKLVSFLRDPKDPAYAKDPKSAMILKFGSPLPNDSFQFDEFKDRNVYRKAFETEAKSMEPTQFAGGDWRNVLRYVPDWTDKQPESWMIWLALEDLWVQRGLLDPIRTVTKDMAIFKPVDEKGADGKPVPAGLKRTFVSPIWQLDLEVKAEGPRRYLTGKIKNLTDRVQLLGIGNIMTLNVYFDNQIVPFEFRVEGEYVEAGKKDATTIQYVPLYHDIPPDISPTAISKVTQVFDARTVPVKRIDRITIGKTSNRHANTSLKQPKFLPEAPVAAPDAPAGGDGADGALPKFGGGRMGAGGSMATAAAGLEGTFEPLKYRYIEVTDQVRRTPVAIVLVVDSLYLQDVLAAYSNSKLRFQIAQVHYKRFRDKLTIPTGPSGSSPGNGGSGSEGGTMFGNGLGGDAERGGMLSGGMAMGGRGMGGGSGGMAGMMASMMGARGGRTPGMASMAGGGMGGGFGSMVTSSGVAESQTAAGLIELTIYGVVSLYDRFGTTPDAAAAISTEKPGTPAPAPSPMTPANPANPAAPAPTPPPPGTSNPMPPGTGNDPKPGG